MTTLGGTEPLIPNARQRPRAALLAIFGVLGVCLLAYVISEMVRRSGQSWPLLDNWGVAGFEILVSGLSLSLVLARTRRGRSIALMLGLGVLAWSIGDLVIAFESVGGATPPTPSLADVFYLAFYPLSYAGLTLLVREQVERFNLANWLDGAVAGLGAAAICAAFAFHGILKAAGGDAAAVAINLAYPIGDLLLIGLLVGFSAVLPGRRSASWLLLAAGFALNAIGDTCNLFSSSFGSSHIGMLFNAVAWPTSILLVATALWLRPARTGARVEAKVGFLLPGLAAIAALVILLVASFEYTWPVAVALAAATLALAGARFGLSLRALRTLTEYRRRLAVTDELTGLGNRRALTQLLDPLLAAHAEHHGSEPSLAFLFVDLNRFKEVNDSFGHPAGDDLLRQLGARLDDSLRKSDLVVRLGGDEFAVALMDADPDRAHAVAERLIARIEQPFLLGSVRAKVSASIGIAIVPEDATDAAGVMACADRAMYRAKLSGRDIANYREDLDGRHSLHLAEELKRAIGQRELVLHYQPQLDLVSGEIVAVEALVRWPHPRLGLVPPLEFLPLAEEAELMGPLTAAVLDEALSQCAAWRAAGRHVTVSVNVSTTNVIDPGFPDQVEAALRRHGLAAAYLVLEITETTMIADFDRCKHAIEALQSLGLVVSVDDFGAGFTSLTYLSSLAVGELKLDRTFIVGLSTANGGQNLALVRATIALAHAIGLRVVAEGIEDRATLHLLRSLGCDLAQGYLISKPKRAGELSFQEQLSVVGPAGRRIRTPTRSLFLAPRPQLGATG